MPAIQVYNMNDALMGTGNGVVNTSAQTATIPSWTDKPGLQVGKESKLKESGAPYNGKGWSIGENDPVAQFVNVV